MVDLAAFGRALRFFGIRIAVAAAAFGLAAGLDVMDGDEAPQASARAEIGRLALNP